MCKIKPLKKIVKVGFPCQRAQWHLSDFASAQVLTGLWKHPLTDHLNALKWGTYRFQRNSKSVQLYLKNYFFSEIARTQSHISLRDCKGSMPFPIRWSLLKNLISALSSEWLDVVMAYGSLQVGEGILSQVRYFYLYPYHYATTIN